MIFFPSINYFSEIFLKLGSNLYENRVVPIRIINFELLILAFLFYFFNENITGTSPKPVKSPKIPFFWCSNYVLGSDEVESAKKKNE